jgi:hypothetical protein
MTKLCARGKAAAKRKFKVYPSAYANAYASKICAGKVKDPSGVKRKDFKGPKPVKKGAMIKASEGKQIKDDYSFLDDLKDPNRRREAMAGYRGRKIRKQEQKRGPVTYKKGKDTEEILSYPNPFIDVLQMENVYGKDKGKKRLKFGKTDAEKASESRFKKAEGGFNKVGNHEVMGSPISVDVDDDNLMNSSAQAYYKDLLK